MTSLGYEIVKKKSDNKWVTVLEVAGDLSANYAVRPKSAIHRDYLQGIGIKANSLDDVDKIIALCNEHGYDKAYELWHPVIMKDSYHFGYLPKAKALKYLNGAYGAYADKLRKEQGRK